MRRNSSAYARGWTDNWKCVRMNNNGECRLEVRESFSTIVEKEQSRVCWSDGGGLFFHCEVNRGWSVHVGKD